jgi:hypothetical protein
MVKIDFLSGYNPKQGYLSCDYIYTPRLDHIFDLSDYRIQGVEHSSVSLIRCSNALHHIQDLNRLAHEFLRILQNNGKILIIECTQKAYKANVLLDTIWYRSVNRRDDVWFSSVYRNYESIFTYRGFVLINSCVRGIKEIKVFKKR